MQEKEIKLLFKTGADFQMAEQRTTLRTFRTLDAAFRTAPILGFRQPTIKASQHG